MTVWPACKFWDLLLVATCNTNDPSFVIGSCQSRFLVLIYDHSVTTYIALDVTHVCATYCSWSPMSASSVFPLPFSSYELEVLRCLGDVLRGVLQVRSAATPG